MSMLYAASTAISNIMVVSAVILFLSVVTERSCSKLRFAVIAFTAAITGFMIQLLFREINGNYLNESYFFLLLFLDFPRLCLLTLIALKNFGFREIVTTLIIQFMCLVLSSSVTALLPTDITENNLYAVCIPKIAVPACILILSFVFKRKTKYNAKIVNGAYSSIPVHIYIFVLIALFLEDGLVELLCYGTPKIEIKIKVAKILLLFLIICVTVLIISLTVNVLYQKYYARVNNILEDQVNSQLIHYKKREKIDLEIQSFRHDFNNHVKCLESLMAAQKFNEATAYLEKISGMMPFGEFLFRTGNYISDAILTEAQENCAKDNININFKGCIPQNVDSTDLCIILSNALKNAIEACHDLTENKIVFVYGNCQQGVMVLIIKNPTSIKGCAKDIFPTTSKPDKLSHGFGFYNMQHIVNKYGGTMHTLIEDGFFTLSITLELQ